MDKKEFLQNIFGFEGEEGLKAAAAFEEVSFKKDECVIMEGDSSDSIYIIFSGLLRTYIKDEVGEETISISKDGDVLGEIGFLTGSKRTAICVAMKDSALLKFSMDRFEKIKSENPVSAVRIYERLVIVLSNRLKDTTARLFGRFL